MRRHLSFSNVIAMIALFVVLGGGAYAVDAVTSKLKGKEKKQVTKIAKKQAKKQIAKKEPNLNVNSAKTADSATSATEADTAKSVDGVDFAKFDYSAVDGAGESTIATIAGLQIKASCDGSGDLDLTATATGNNGTIHVAAINLNNDGNSDESTYGEDDNFDAGDTRNLLPNNTAATERDDSVQATFTFRRADGTIVTATYFAEEDPGAQPTVDCAVAGTAQIAA